MSTAAPTTIPPTTVAPTTIPPTFATTAPPTDIEAGPIEIEFGFWANFSYSPAGGRDATLDSFYRADPLEVELSVEGEMFNKCFAVSPIEVEAEVLSGIIVIGLAISAGPIEVELAFGLHSIIVGTSRTNWVKWSKIGYLDFTIDESNLAGERPLDWSGYVYCVKKLNEMIVAYGQNGVSLLKASGVHYGMDTIYRVGLMSKGAVAGSDEEHYFIDNIGQLWKLSKELELLDYSEYLSGMVGLVMSLDINTGLLYICDGLKGYIYSTKSKSFGEGPANISGIGVRSGNLYVVSPTEIVTPKFEICTDIYDFGTRKAKTIYSIEVGTNMTDNLHASVDYRIGYKDDFKQIPWALVNPNGFAYPKCYGNEFRFRLRSFIYEYLELDYMKISGIIHDFSYLDTASEKAGYAIKGTS